MIDLLNRQFGDYHIFRHLGVGAMADVYLARQESLSRRVALKVLKPELADDELYVKRFAHEARAVARIVHPNIVHIYEVGERDGLHFIAQEYVAGGNLLQTIEKRGPLPVRQVASMLWLIASALEKTSLEGIVHRDIKPENILLGDSGEVKIADFGLARLLTPDTDPSPALTQAGMAVGTPLYMSPEQAQGRPLDHRSDMYSLGITAYHALAGKPPFQGETSLAVALAHVNTPPKPLEQHRSDIPPTLARIVHRMIAKRPEERYQSFLELRQDLKLLQLRNPDLVSAASDSGGWDPGGSVQAATVSATGRLRALMRKESLAGKRFAAWARPLALFCVCFLLAGAATSAWIHLQPRLLQEPERTVVPRRDNVAGQWLYAAQLKSDDAQRQLEAWQAIETNFPDATIWVVKSKRQMIRIYCLEKNPAGAMPLFQEFADMGDAWPDCRALGLAGLAWCYASMKRYDMAITALHESFYVALELPDDDPLTEELHKAALDLIPAPPQSPLPVSPVPPEIQKPERSEAQ